MQVIRPTRYSDPLSLRFDVGPAYDLVISLAAVAQPERYELSASWARQARARLPAALRREIRYFFGDPSVLGTGIIQVIPDLSSPDADTFLHALGEMDAVDFAAALLSRGAGNRRLQPVLRRSARGKTLSPSDEELLSGHLDGLRAESRRRFRAILADAAGSHRRYAELLRAHHDNWFRDHYPEVAPVLDQRAKQGRRVIGKLPTKEVIARVTGGFTLQNPSARSVVLVPSYYAAPFVFVVRDGRNVVMVYGARPESEMGGATVDADTVRVLKALADETRLRILQMLVKRPLYGQQIAEALGVSHPTVSHHMAQLRIAGLTRTELAEDGNKTYSVQPETIEMVCNELRSAFISPDLRTGEGR